MKIRGRPLLLAIAITSGIFFLVSAADIALLLAFPDALDTITTFPVDPNAPVDPSTMLSEGAILLTTLSCILLLCQVGTSLGSGALYAFFHNREVPVDVQDGAIGGAISPAVAGLLISVIFSVIRFVVPALQEPNVSAVPGMTSELGGFIAAGTLAFTLISLCCGVLINAFLGALGGAIGASIFNR